MIDLKTGCKRYEGDLELVTSVMKMILKLVTGS